MWGRARRATTLQYCPGSVCSVWILAVFVFIFQSAYSQVNKHQHKVDIYLHESVRRHDPPIMEMAINGSSLVQRISCFLSVTLAFWHRCFLEPEVTIFGQLGRAATVHLCPRWQVILVVAPQIDA